MSTHTLAASTRASGVHASTKIEHASLDYRVGQYLTTDVDSNTLWDNTVVFVTPAMASNTHAQEDYCQLLITGKHTALKGGCHYDLSCRTNNKLVTTVAQGMGLADDSFGGHDKSGEYVNNLANGPITKIPLS